MRKARPKVKFRQAKVWRILQERPMCSRDMGKELGVTTTAANHIMLRMQASGCVVRAPGKRNAIWHATGVEPEDMRGTSVGSTSALMWSVSCRREEQKGVQGGREGTSREAVPIPSLAELLLAR